MFIWEVQCFHVYIANIQLLAAEFTVLVLINDILHLIVLLSADLIILQFYFFVLQGF